MYDTHITVVGTALTTPDRKLIEKTNAVVASFRVISNARRFDKETQQWVDGANLRIRVTCWRRLADNVVGSIFSGDPVVVYGRIATREWQNEQGESRISYEIDAEAVGHDLSRGRAEFKKMRPDAVQSVVEDADSENRINGEIAHAIPDPGSPVVASPGEESYDFRLGDGYGAADATDADGDALTILRSAGLDPTSPEGEDETDEEELVGAAAGSGGSSGRGRRRGR